MSSSLCPLLFRSPVGCATPIIWAQVSLKGLERNLFVKPRKFALVRDDECGEPVDFMQVWQEVQVLCKTHRITRFGCKKVERSYAFEEVRGCRIETSTHVLSPLSDSCPLAMRLSLACSQSCRVLLGGPSAS